MPAAPQAMASRIGPNAIIRMAEALDAFESKATTSRVFSAANLSGYLEIPPADMVAEAEVFDLHQALHATLDDVRARSIGWIAGWRTADYLLAHRIPKAAQVFMKAAPAAVASRILSTAIQRNSWTFAGSGTFTAHHGQPLHFEIASCPLCRGVQSASPYCGYYAATFERLYGVLVHPRTQVHEVACVATGAPKCIFEISWR